MTTDGYLVRAAATDADLRGILALQAANLREALEPDERRAQGFVSLRHDLDALRALGARHPHVVATPAGSDAVVAYALVMLRDERERFPLLEPMFAALDRLAAPGGPLHGRRWYVMGQVCVAEAHRGRGLVEALYAEHRARMAGAFDLMVTEIDRANGRSLRAHERAGFETLHEYRAADAREWRIVALPLR